MTKNSLNIQEQVLIIAAVISSSLLLRAAVSLGPHSGQGSPPLHGDFEAQRHWLEVTVSLPMTDWYRHTVDNDLSYWGLDYPPLTAYVSWLCGQVALVIYPSYVALGTSRGIETVGAKAFMRSTVIALDLCILVPGALLLLLAMRIHRVHSSLSAFHTSVIWLLTILIQPALVIIDHGHFQYNGVGLGLTAAAIALAILDWDIMSAVLFCMALNFKQMSLYHSTPFFFYMLGKACLRRHNHGIIAVGIRVACIGSAVIGTFIVLWSPIVFADTSVVQAAPMALHVLERIFPFSRGLFEDKVANIWCTLDNIIKLRTILSVDYLVLISVIVTSVTLLPSGLHLAIRPTPRSFLYSLACSSLSFFLFSYQVHEKSILLATLPIVALIFHEPVISPWFISVAMASMYPLLHREGLGTTYFVLLTIWFIVWRRLLVVTNTIISFKYFTLLLSSISSFIVLHTLYAFVPPPARLPHLWVVALLGLSCLHFLLFFLYLHYRQFYSVDYPFSDSKIHSE